MQRDTVFLKPGAPGDFVFDDEVAAVFDDMLERSIPFYAEQEAMVRTLVRRHWTPGTAVYDLGCSRATALLALAVDLADCHRLIGYDSSEAMLARARDQIAAAGLERRVNVALADLNAPSPPIALENAGIVTACWTLQFVDPQRRPALVRRVHDALRLGGAFIVCEKVIAADPHLDREFIDRYFDFKRRNGYSEQEIRRKEEALDGVLIPLTFDANLALLKDAGFRTVESFFRWFNFAAFLCLK